MRLTLRTLLAYLDDILEPIQARDIGAKIADSTVAQGLVNRIREVTRRRRLLAPDVDGPGSGIDPNLVAEYLDNTLPPGDIADVEQVFIGSDINLAEVAASHQILTLVLGEPVQIVPRSRERMYALGPMSKKPGGGFNSPATGGPVAGKAVAKTAVSKASAAAAPADGQAVAAAPVAPVSMSSIDRVPEYLRPKPLWRRALPWVLVLGLGGVFAAVLYTDPMFNGGAAKPAPGENRQSPAVEPAAVASAETPVAAEVATAEAAVPLPAPVPEQAETIAAPPAAKPAAPVSIDPPPPEEAGDAKKPVAEATPPAPTPASAKPAKPATEVATVTPRPAPPPAPNPPSEKPVAPAARPGGTKPESTKPATAKPDAERPAPEAVTPGKKQTTVEYTSTEGVLLHYDAEARDWFLLPRRSLVHSGEAIAAPEPFDSTLNVNKGQLTITALGGTSLHVLGPTEFGPDNAAPFGIDLHQGRLLLTTKPSEGGDAKPPAVTLSLLLGADLYRLDIQGSDTVCAVESQPREPEFFEQDLGGANWQARMWVSTGKAIVTEPSGRKLTLDAKASVVLAPSPPPAKNAEEGAAPKETVINPSSDLPKWIDLAAPRLITRRHANLFEREFNPGQGVSMTIPAVVNNPAFQLSELAAKTLALTGNYQALVKALAEAPHKETRLAAINGLRAWLVRAPGNGALLKAELQKTFPPAEIDILYRLLWGFSGADARDPDKSTQLVDWLEHEELAIRELAFFHLHRITGLKHEYDAQIAPNLRALSVNRWRTHLKKEGGALIKK